MTGTAYTITLDHSEAWTRLRGRSFGRLAVVAGGQPDIFPVNFLASDTSILIRTDDGTKVDRISGNPLVALEVDDTDDKLAWSVVVKGTAERLTDPADIAAAREAPLWAWAPEAKDVFLRIRPTEVTGRMFSRS